MKKLNTVQKTILGLGILGTAFGLYGKFQGWDYEDYFPLFYTSLSFMWIAFLNPDRASGCSLKRKGIKKES